MTRLTIVRTLILPGLISILAAPAFAANVDGFIILDSGEYSWNTDQTPNPKHNTHNHGSPGSEVDDGSGGNRWDINFLGSDIDRSGPESLFQFGAKGGSILSGHNGGTSGPTGDGYYLSDFAINVYAAGESEDPTTDSSGWDYAVRLLSIAGTTATFGLFENDDDYEWVGRDIYSGAHAPGHITETFRLEKKDANGNIVDGTPVETFTGQYTQGSSSTSEDYVLEGSFDLGLLSLFDEKTGGRIITYLTMSCVNDEAIVDAHVSPVPLPSAVWLFGSALLGFIGMSRRTKV